MRSEKKSFTGHFWLPSDSDNQLSGTLTIDSSGKPGLELIGTFDRVPSLFSDIEPIERLFGRVDKGFVTLDGCQYESKETVYGPGIGKCRIVASIAYLGAHLVEGPPAVFGALTFSIDGLEEWHGVTGISFGHRNEDDALQITFSNPEKITLWSCDNATLEICFTRKIPGRRSDSSITVTQSSFLRLSQRNPVSIDELIGSALRVVNLISIAAVRVVSIHDVHAFTPSLADRRTDPATYQESVEVFFRTAFSRQEKPDLNARSMLFGLRSLPEPSQEFFSTWFATHDKLMPAIGLFLGVIAGNHVFVTDRFLALCQVLESLHRRTTNVRNMDEVEFAELLQVVVDRTPEKHRELVRRRLLHANEPTLRSRLNLLFEPFAKFFGGEKVVKQLVREIVEARNFLTHFDPAAESRATDGHALGMHSDYMEVMFLMALLRELHFSEATIHELMQGKAEVFRRLNWKEGE